MKLGKDNTIQMKWATAVKYLLLALLPVVAFYLMESYEHNPFAEVRPVAQILNIILFECIGWFLYFLFGSSRCSIRTLLGLSMVFGLTNHYVMAFRSTPFVPWDIYSIGTAASVANNYDFTPTKRVVIVTLVFLALAGLAQFVDLKLSVRKRWQLRLGGSVGFLAGLITLTNLVQVDSLQTKWSLYPYLFTPAYMTKVNGMALTFAMDLEYLVVEKPTGYSAAKAEQTLEEYTTEIATEEDEYPNIIVIMDEAFSDLAVLGDFEASEDYMPFIHSLEEGYENTITGYANVSVCGGNTANSEFEFLTGNSMYFLPVGSIPYQQYLTGETESLPNYLKSLGYVTYGQHPYYASGWKRETVYEWLGLDNTTFIYDYPYRSFLRKYVDDESSFETIIYTYEHKEEGTPMFLFNVTMQNHGSYYDLYDNFTPTITVDGVSSTSLSQYLSLLKETDAAFENLIDYFSGVDEKTVIVFFGDHQPNNSVAYYIQALNGIDSNNLTTEENEARYKVPFVIWANYDIEEGTEQETSLNYLASEVLTVAGVPTSPYMNFLLDLREYYPIISAVRLEENADVSEDEAEEMLLLYQQLQYYNLFDWEE